MAYIHRALEPYMVKRKKDDELDPAPITQNQVQLATGPSLRAPSAWPSVKTSTPEEEGMLEAEEMDLGDEADAQRSAQQEMVDELEGLDNEAAFNEVALNGAPEMQMMPLEAGQSKMAWQGDLAPFYHELKNYQERQAEGLKSLEDYANQYRKLPQQTDYTALAAFADYLAPGGKALEAAKSLKPMTREERALKNVELEGLLQKQRDISLKTPLDLLQSQLQAQGKLAAIDQMKGRQSRFETAQSLKKEDTIRKDVTKVADEYGQRNEQINIARETISNGQARDIGMILGSIARGLGGQKGAISDRDVAYILPPDIATNMAQLQNYLGANKPISPELRASLMRLVERAQDNAGHTYKHSLDRRRKNYSGGMYGDLMQEGQVGDEIFKAAEEPIQNLVMPANDVSEKQNRIKELEAKQKGQ